MTHDAAKGARMLDQAALRAERERKSKMTPFRAEIHVEVRAESLREARLKVSQALYPLVVRAALQAGDVLEMAQKQNNTFSGSGEPSDRPGYYRFTADLGFVSDSRSWEAASAWLRQVLEGFRHADITVLDLAPYTGFSD